MKKNIVQEIFQTKHFKFPYRYKFPGQASDEQILYLTRENRLFLLLRRVFVAIVAVFVLVTGLFLKQVITQFLGIVVGGLFEVVLIGITLAFLLIGWWWVTILWRKSIALVTTKRLIKFIYTTPASRYSIALPLNMVVDTGAYTKGIVSTFLGLGTFIARSSASSSGRATDDPSRINKKYFYIEHVRHAEDLQHYVSKVLAAFRQYPEKLANFRPFIPEMKGEVRAKFIRDNFPEFWS